MTQIHVRAETIPILSVTAFEGNARRGNIDAIAESLRVNGQYRPIVVREEDNTILAGNHTWLAARRLGWENIAATFISCDEDTARKINLADNRISDLASYSEEPLLNLLRSMPDLEGTGFAQTDIDKLDGLFAGEQSGGELSFTESEFPLEVGIWRASLDGDIYGAWKSQLTSTVGEKPGALVKEVRRRLILPEEQKPEKTKVKVDRVVQEVQFSMSDTTLEEVGTLIPYPDNAREGDVGAIAESLKAFGQYRPIVVNRRDNVILVGNHTWFAATMLRMEKVAVTWVDVDEEAAKRIILADNRTSDLASYDENALAKLLQAVGSFTGTGFDGDDVDAIIAGASGKPSESVKRAYVKVGDIRFSLREDLFMGWAIELPAKGELQEIMSRLEIPMGAIQ